MGIVKLEVLAVSRIGGLFELPQAFAVDESGRNPTL